MIAVSIFSAIVSFSCSLLGIKGSTVHNYHLVQSPPNCIEISTNFYSDQSEVANVHYREYLYWMGKVYGANSQEFLALLPDTNVWMKIDTSMRLYSWYYFRHPKTNHYPLVGITREQAIAFSKWRSDRVFEMFLIEFGKIEQPDFSTRETPESHFTIERYFNGEYGGITLGEMVRYYPEYRLPTLEEWKTLLRYSDSLDSTYFTKCKSKYCKECLPKIPFMHSDIQLPVSKTFNEMVVTIPIFSGCFSRRGSPLYNLRGNVSEWLSEPGVAAGGGWLDSRERILREDTFHFDQPNAWTGFRNVFEWKEWKDTATNP